MTKKLHVVRVVLADQEKVRDAYRRRNTPQIKAFLECLRYAGTINVLHDGESHLNKGLPDTMLVFDLFPPKAVFSNSLAWARENAARMRSFGFEADAVESAAEVAVYVIKDNGAGWACYDGVEGWHFTTLSANATVFIGEAAAHRVIDQHYPGQKLQVIPRISV